MKKSISLFIMIFMFGVNNGFSYFRAYKLPSYSYSWDILEYQKFETQIKVQGLFYETGIQMKIKLGKIWSGNCRTADAGKYEFLWIFDLPDESVLTDCQVWLEHENKFVSAQLIDLSTAESIYDPNSPSTPNVLLREYRNRQYDGRWHHFYQLKISPVDRDEAKEIIIKYLTPCQMFWNVLRVEVHSRQFYLPYYTTCNNHAPAEFKVVDYDYPETAPKAVYKMPFNWQKQGDFWYAKTGPDDPQYDDNSILSVPMEDQSGKFLQTFDDGSKQFYQLATLPHISYDDRPARNIIVAIDLVEEINAYYNTSRDILLDRVRYPLSQATTDKDSIAFVVSSFNTKWLDNTFVQCTNELIDERLDATKLIVPILNSLPFVLKEAVQFLNNRDIPGEIWIVSNDTEHGSPAATAMDIIHQTHLKAKNTIKFRIKNAALSGSGHYISNKYYRGNEYLYENLYRLSKGSLVSLRYEMYYDWGEAMLDCLGPVVSSVEIDPMPENGVCYSRIDLNRGRKNFHSAARYFQIGIYEGGTPFDLHYFGNFNNDLYYKQFSMSTNQNQIPDDAKQQVKTYWYAYYIIHQLLEQPQSYETIKYIEELSVDNRILTPYSGFVLPGPDGYLGFQKLVAEDSLLIEGTPEEENAQYPRDFTLSAFPNPFNPQTTISIEWPQNSSTEKANIEIFNILGQQIMTFKLENLDGSATRKIAWDGCNDLGEKMVSGIYIIVLRIGEVTKSLKVTLLR